MSTIDPKLQNILNQLANFGFSFYGYDENGIPIVKGPNEQVVEINVAINFVNQQIAAQKQSESSSGSPEQPHMPENLDTVQGAETTAERAVESSIEKKVEQQAQRPDTTKQPKELQVQQKAPKVAIIKPVSPYGDGFNPTKFKAGDLQSTLAFIEKNSKISKTSSNKWLAEQFKKFVSEFKASNNKET